MGDLFVPVFAWVGVLTLLGESFPLAVAPLADSVFLVGFFSDYLFLVRAKGLFLDGVFLVEAVGLFPLTVALLADGVFLVEAVGLFPLAVALLADGVFLVGAMGFSPLSVFFHLKHILASLTIQLFPLAVSRNTLSQLLLNGENPETCILLP